MKSLLLILLIFSAPAIPDEISPSQVNELKLSTTIETFSYIRKRSLVHYIQINGIFISEPTTSHKSPTGNFTYPKELNYSFPETFRGKQVNIYCKISEPVQGYQANQFCTLHGNSNYFVEIK